MKSGATILKRLLPALTTSALGSVLPVAIASAAAADIVAVGPIDSVSKSGHEFSVLGRGFHSDYQIELSPGEYVIVHGNLEADGSVVDIWVEPIGSYNAGSDFVYQKGIVSELKPLLGQLSIGGARIDYTPSMYGAAGEAPELGSVISTSGIQPSVGSPVLVDNLASRADKALEATLDAGGVQSALNKGTGVEHALNKGTGLQSALNKGTGVQDALNKGTGLQSALNKGTGVQDALNKGTGLQSALNKGTGVQDVLNKGTGLQSALNKGTGVQDALNKGTGLQSALNKGTGVQDALNKGTGFEITLNKGTGVQAALNKGTGF